MTVRVLVADDESMARRRLVRLLAALPDVEVVAECEDGLQVLGAIREAAPDVVLLDVQMPDLDGVATLRAIGPDGPAVVLVTAHRDHAVAAFDGGAVDYVLKPVEPARLQQALERASSRRGPRGVAQLGRLAVHTAKGIVLVPFDAISALVIDGESVVIHTDQGRMYTEARLSALEERLPDATFRRVHRRAVVHLGRISRLEPAPTGGYLAHLDDGTRVAVSRAAARELRKRWELG